MRAHLNRIVRKALEEEIACKGKEKRDAILTDEKDADTQVRGDRSRRHPLAKRRGALEAIQQQNQRTQIHKIEDGKNTIIGELNQRATIKSKMGRFDTMMEQVNIRRGGIKFQTAPGKIR